MNRSRYNALMARSNWNKMAKWYDSVVGKGGHGYHQKYAIPTTIKLLELKKGQAILDMGCGQGVLSTMVKKAGCGYFGVDSSRTMIKNAMIRHKKEGKFFVGSASKISKIPEINFIKFDSAVFLLSIQDMDPLGKIIKETAKLLKKDGKIIIFLLHPAFRIPRQSGWSVDKSRNLVSRRVDRYLTTKVIPLNTRVNNITSFFYHRPIQTYFRELGKNGFVVDWFEEIAEDKKGEREFPLFLAIRGIKSA